MSEWTGVYSWTGVHSHIISNYSYLIHCHILHTHLIGRGLLMIIYSRDMQMSRRGTVAWLNVCGWAPQIIYVIRYQMASTCEFLSSLSLLSHNLALIERFPDTFKRKAKLHSEFLLALHQSFQIKMHTISRKQSIQPIPHKSHHTHTHTPYPTPPNTPPSHPPSLNYNKTYQNTPDTPPATSPPSSSQPHTPNTPQTHHPPHASPPAAHWQSSPSSH